MESLYLANSVVSAPTVPQGTAAGHPTDGSSTGGIPATVPGAVWYEAVTAEQIAVITAGGLTPDRNDNTQMAAAIQAMINAAKNALQAQIDNLAASVFASGSIAYFAVNSAPTGWLVADGSAVSRSTYSDLFSAIGTTYGSGNGSTTFNLPNLIGRFAEGAAAAEVGIAMTAGLPDITGQLSGLESADTSLGIATGAFSFSNTVANGAGHRNTDDHVVDFKASSSNPIYGSSSTVQPAALKLLPCIHI